MKSPFNVRAFFRTLPPWSRRDRVSKPGMAPEFDDLELIRTAAPETVVSLPGWDRWLALLYGGLRRG